MEDILDKAAELGRMIQETTIYQNYKSTLDNVEKDPESSELMNKYNSMVESLDQRIAHGDTIESFEQESLKELTHEIENNNVLMDFLGAQKKYSNLLNEIQQELSGSGNMS